MRNDRTSRSPFDSSALDRLRRMGLATADGSVERDAMAVFCCIFAGQFYDDLCDYHQDDAHTRAKLPRSKDISEEHRVFKQIPIHVWIYQKVCTARMIVVN